MVIQKLDAKTLNEIIQGKQRQLYASDLQLTVLLNSESDRLALRTEIYRNEQGIPKAIRMCLEEGPTSEYSEMLTNFILDEIEGTITLDFIGAAPQTVQELEEQLNHFEHQAHLWVGYLEDNDPREYAYIYNRK